MCGKLLLIIRRDGYNMPVNILLADDHRMVREGLKQLLEMDDNINVVRLMMDMNALIMPIKHSLILFFLI